MPPILSCEASHRRSTIVTKPSVHLYFVPEEVRMSSLVWSPNADQQRAIETLSGFCVVLAAHGTGKTETLAAKTATILQHGGTPLAVTYTRAAAHELIQRLGQLQERVTACTCHSLAFTLFRRLASTVRGTIPRLLDTRRHEREAILR